MTSNIGSSDILELEGSVDGEAYRQMKESVLGQLKHHFRPEFLNRVDELVVFHGLSKDHLVAIIEIQLERLAARLKSRQLKLVVTSEAKWWLAEAGYDPVYGARPLKRVLQRELESSLARKILAGEISDGSTIKVDVAERELVIEVQVEFMPQSGD
jgi:ATP-dependent Clp protease ATP-binding subunit ClpA